MVSTGRLPHRGPRRDPRTAAGSFQNAQNFGQTRQSSYPLAGQALGRVHPQGDPLHDRRREIQEERI